MKRLFGVLALSALGIGWASTTSLAQPRLSPPANSIPGSSVDETDESSEEPDVYTRGALHEAFATPASNDPVRTAVIDREAPAPIEELPPEDKPEGENVEWIPGYWAFDEELNDFIWISGMWRDVPPDREWIPGYWARVSDGWQWVPGMWSSAQQQEVAYYDEPPASQERGASSPAPGDNYFYIPGCWEYRNQWVWRPGYWAPRQLEWIWIPARWVWTPYGYCLTPGYWDYALVDRGLCYAPVYFRPHHHHHRRPYRPVVVLNTWDQFTMHLFVQPRFNCYVFGNYYHSPRDRYVPWHRYHGGHHGHDPLFAYYSWRNGPDYGRRLDRWHNHFVADVHARPPVTMREQVRINVDRGPRNVVQARIAIDLSRRDRDRDRDIKLPVSLTKISKEEETRQRTRVDHFRELQQKRVKLEVADGPKPGERSQARNEGPRKLVLDTPRERDRVRPDTSKIKLPEAPDKLRNVKPDSPTEKQARVPSPRRRPEGLTKAETLEAIPEPPAGSGDKKPGDKAGDDKGSGGKAGNNRRPRPETPERGADRERPARPERERPAREGAESTPKNDGANPGGRPSRPQTKPQPEPRDAKPQPRDAKPAEPGQRRPGQVNEPRRPPQPRNGEAGESRSPRNREQPSDRGTRETKEKEQKPAQVPAPQKPEARAPQRPDARPQTPRNNVVDRPANRVPGRDVNPAREQQPRSPRTEREVAKPKTESVQIPRAPEARRNPPQRPERTDPARTNRNSDRKERAPPRPEGKKEKNEKKEKEKP